MGEVMVSINCVTYNHEDFIAEAIEGFLMQKTDFDIEILIYDDASTDRTPEIIREYEVKYPNLIKPIYGKVNQYSKGVKVGNLNIKRAKGKYIASCEGDDYWTRPNKLQRQVDYMEKNPDCTVCVHTVKKVGVNKVVLGYERPYQINTKCFTPDMILGGGYFVGSVSLLYPKVLMENPPEFYVTSPVGDYPLQIYLTSKGYAYYIDEDMATYRVGVKKSWSHNQNTGKRKRFRQINHANGIINMLKLFDEYTDYEYTDFVYKKIEYYEFKKSLLQKCIKRIMTNNYFKTLSLKEKIYVFIKIYFPTFNQKIYKDYIEKLLMDNKKTLVSRK